MSLIEDYGFDAGMLPDKARGVPARITAVYRQRYELISDDGECAGRLKTKEYYDGCEDFPTVGDFVLMEPNPGGDCRITATLPRRTFFSRRDPTPGRGEQAVAANFDYVFIMQSLNRDLNVKRLERYLTLAWQSGAVPVVVLTKADISDADAKLTEEIKKAAAGVEVFAVSAKTGEGLRQLEGYLKPAKTAVFLGSSGVGKSTLVNAIAGEEIMATGDIRENDSRGRHTTTHRQLIMLASGVMIIDTPGMRELGMWDVSSGLGSAFSDVEEYIGKCRFADCTHRNEPGCAVTEALADGRLTQSRWESYLKLKAEAEYAEDRNTFMQQKRQWHKDVAKRKKDMKQNEPW